MEDCLKFMENLSKDARIYYLSKLAGLTIGCVDQSEVKNDAEKLVASATSCFLMAAMVGEKVSTEDKLMIDIFIGQQTGLPETAIDMINGAIEAYGCNFSIKPETHDVMYV